MASLERLRTCPGLVSFVGVGALCPAFIVSGGVGCLVVRVVVSGLRCGGVVGRFPGLLFVGVCLYGFTVSRACGGVFGAYGYTHGGGIDKGRNRAREYAEYSQKIKRPYKR